MEENFKINDSENDQIFHEIYSEPSKKNYPTNKTDVYHIDDFGVQTLSILKITDQKTIEDTDMF